LIREFHTLSFIFLAQSLIGVSGAIVPPCITAITIGMVKRSRFPKRTTINEFFNHIGNLCTALATGIIAHYFGHNWILYIVMICAIASIISLLLINPNEIDYNSARELPEINTKVTGAIPLIELLKNRSLLIFCASVILFHFSNAAQLPLVGEVLAKNNPQNDSLFMAGSIILAQLVMAIVAYSLGFLMTRFGRKPFFMLAFLILSIRALLYTTTTDPYLFLSIQLFDGIGAGIFGVIAVVTVSDIAKGTGRFNISIGLIALCTSIGAGMSNLLGGFIAKQYGFSGGFITLAFIAIIGLSFYGFFMPETKTYEG
jgi:MFS family permease